MEIKGRPSGSPWVQGSELFYSLVKRILLSLCVTHANKVSRKGEIHAHPTRNFSPTGFVPFLAIVPYKTWTVAQPTGVAPMYRIKNAELMTQVVVETSKDFTRLGLTANVKNIAEMQMIAAEDVAQGVRDAHATLALP